MSELAEPKQQISQKIILLVQHILQPSWIMCGVILDHARSVLSVPAYSSISTWKSTSGVDTIHIFGSVESICLYLCITSNFQKRSISNKGCLLTKYRQNSPKIPMRSNFSEPTRRHILARNDLFRRTDRKFGAGWRTRDLTGEGGD